MLNSRALTVWTLCVLLWAVGAPRAARAQMVVSGPTAASVHTLQSWFDHHMPAACRPRTRLVVRQLTDTQMAAYLKGDDPAGPLSPDPSFQTDASDDIDGVFEDNPPRIALRVPATGSQDFFTFAHEYGHYVWFALLSKDDRRRYESLYNRQRSDHRLVTRYAAEGVEEGFAEAFSFFVNEPQLLARRDSLSFQFLSRWAGDPPARDPGSRDAGARGPSSGR